MEEAGERMSTLRYLATRPGAFFRSVHALSARERKHLVDEMVKVRGLMPLLMKSRNGQRWTDEEKQELAGHLRRFSRISPYLVVLAMPGGLLMLPALAWWLDRRRNRSRGGPAPRS
jgi:hypothetical protein